MYSENASDVLPNDLTACISTLPLSAGAYALQLHLSHSHRIQVGKFAQAIFPTGEYIYLGSAHGPGGLRARLGRHLRGAGKPHWHIDYLRCVAEVQSAGYMLVQEEDSKHPTECTWSQALSKFPRAYIPLAGFGAGDCHSGCQAHLVGFPASNMDILEKLQNTYSLVIVNCQDLKTTG
jgi:Uri superfamily endonuclease